MHSETCQLCGQAAMWCACAAPQVPSGPIARQRSFRGKQRTEHEVRVRAEAQRAQSEEELAACNAELVQAMAELEQEYNSRNQDRVMYDIAFSPGDDSPLFAAPRKPAGLVRTNSVKALREERRRREEAEQATEEAEKAMERCYVEMAAVEAQLIVAKADIGTISEEGDDPRAARRAAELSAMSGIPPGERFGDAMTLNPLISLR